VWTLLFDDLASHRAKHAVLRRDGRAASFAEALTALRDDAALRTVLTSSLAALPYRAYKWETPVVTRTRLDRLFECVVLDSPHLADRVDATPFSEHFSTAEPVVEFPSLGRDAILVAPCPRTSTSAYGHLAAFLRGAPEAQRHALWQRVGDAMERRVDDRPVWLSTAGGGVAWLHVRLDDRPKYYGYAPYRVSP
jgi:hypothetical protein